jgi:hypothetical protein
MKEREEKTMQEKKYEIGNQTFLQRELLIGQVIPLIENLEGIEIGSLDPKSILRALGPRLTRIIAVVLIPEGVNVKDRKLEEIESHLDNFLSANTAMEIVTDFFVFTPLSSLLSAGREMFAQGNESLKSVVDLSDSFPDSSKTSAKLTADEKTGLSGMSR